jgi:hypothetical protein
VVEPNQRVYPVETVVDSALSQTRRYQALYGYPPGRVEDWYFKHRATFLDGPLGAVNDAESTVGTHVITIPMGGVADFEWQAVNVEGSVIGDVDTQDPATGELHTTNPGDWFDIAFFTMNGTRPHQSEPVMGSLYRGTETLLITPGNTADLSWGLPFVFEESTFVDKGDGIRIEISCRRSDDGSGPPFSPPWFVDVAIIGVRYYPKRS